MTNAKILDKEIKRCEELLKMYQEIPEGFFGAAVLKNALERAKAAKDTGDKTKIARVVSELKEMC